MLKRAGEGGKQCRAALKKDAEAKTGTVLYYHYAKGCFLCKRMVTRRIGLRMEDDIEENTNEFAIIVTTSVIRQIVRSI